MHHPIRNVLKEDDRSVAWLARKLGYSEVYVQSVVAGHFNPSSQFRRKCVEFLGRREEDLFYPTTGSVRERYRRLQESVA